jgi:hypothetical protein
VVQITKIFFSYTHTNQLGNHRPQYAAESNDGNTNVIAERIHKTVKELV